MTGAQRKLVRACAICGGKPTLTTKPRRSGGYIGDDCTLYALHCRNPACPGHKGGWRLMFHHAARAWNGGQGAKASVRRRVIAFETLHGHFS